MRINIYFSVFCLFVSYNCFGAASIADPAVPFVQNSCSISNSEIRGKINPQRYLIGNQCILNFNRVLMAPVGSPHSLGRIPSKYYGLSELSLVAIPKSILPEFGSLGDGRQRVEWTTGFYSHDKYRYSQLSKMALQFKAETKSFMGGQWPTNSRFQYYQLRFRLPTHFNEKLNNLELSVNNKDTLIDKDMSVIIAQWHGTPDRLVYRHKNDQPWQYQALEVKNNTDSELSSTLAKYHQLKEQGYIFDQGGFPPMALKIKDGYIALIANYFRYPVHDRPLTRCPKIAVTGADAAEPGEFYVCNYKTKQLERYKPYFHRGDGLAAGSDWASGVSIIWKQRITPDLFDKWVDLTVVVNWPNWDKAYYDNLHYGTVKLFNTATSELLANYHGPIGNNDQWAPYFKFGIYKSNNSSHLPAQVDYDLSSFYMF